MPQNESGPRLGPAPTRLDKTATLIVNREHLQELQAALDEAAKSPDIRVGLLVLEVGRVSLRQILATGGH